ncbi:MAG: peptidase M20, partial [Gammaproteobacteria bacterium]
MTTSSLALAALDTVAARSFIDAMWDDSIVPTLYEYVKIPNKSPLFDPDWEQHVYIDDDAVLAESWCKQQPINGMTIEVLRVPGRTPLLFIDIPGDSEDTVLLYGHLDKQPEFTGWEEDLGPWK